MAKEKEPELTVAERLLGMVRAATEADLDAVDAEIARREAEVASLAAVRRVLAVQLGKIEAKKPGPAKGTPKKASAPAPSTNGSNGLSVADDRRLKAARYLHKNGVTTAAALCRLFEIPPGSQTQTFEHRWFTKTDGGLELSPHGHEAVRAAG